MKMRTIYYVERRLKRSFYAKALSFLPVSVLESHHSAASSVTLSLHTSSFSFVFTKVCMLCVNAEFSYLFVVPLFFPAVFLSFNLRLRVSLNVSSFLCTAHLHSSPLYCIYYIPLFLCQRFFPPRCFLHFILPQLIFYTYIICAGAVTHRLVSLCVCLCLVCFSDSRHIFCFFFPCIICALLVGYFSVDATCEGLVIHFWTAHVFRCVDAYIYDCMCGWMGGSFIWLPPLFLSLFVTSTAQFSEWENLDCILSGLYGLLHFFGWFVCVFAGVHLRT